MGKSRSTFKRADGEMRSPLKNKKRKPTPTPTPGKRNDIKMSLFACWIIAYIVVGLLRCVVG